MRPDRHVRRLAAALLVTAAAALPATLQAAPGDARSPAIPIYDDADWSVQMHRVASDPAGNFVVAWVELAPGTPSRWYARARAFRPDGTARGPTFTINPAHPMAYGWGPFAIAMDGTGALLAAWSTASTRLLARRLTATGAPLTPALELPGSGDGCDAVDIGGSPTGSFAVAWSCGAYGSLGAAFYSVFRASGKPIVSRQNLASPVPTTTAGNLFGSDFEPQLQVGENGFTALWRRHVPSSSYGVGQLLARSFGPSGVPLGLETIVLEGLGWPPDGKLGGGKLGNHLVAWGGGYGITPPQPVWLQRYDVLGQPREAAVPRHAEQLGCTDDDGDVLLVQRSGDHWGVQLLTRGLAPRTGVLALPFPATVLGTMDVACDADGDFVVAVRTAEKVDGDWRFDLQVQRFAAR